MESVTIIIYGENNLDLTVYSKYNQLINYGFANVKIFVGGMFEWMLLQEVYGSDLFPTTSCELDILKFAS